MVVSRWRRPPMLCIDMNGDTGDTTTLPHAGSPVQRGVIVATSALLSVARGDFCAEFFQHAVEQLGEIDAISCFHVFDSTDFPHGIPWFIDKIPGSSLMIGAGV